MSLRNLLIYDNDNLVNAQLIRDRIIQTEKLINESFSAKEEESIREYNFGTLIQPYELSLVVYNNPKRENNPYVFFYVNTDENKLLLQRVDMMFFIGFADDLRYNDFTKALRAGFENVPNLAFLSQEGIEIARAFSKEYDRQVKMENMVETQENTDVEP